MSKNKKALSENKIKKVAGGNVNADLDNVGHVKTGPGREAADEYGHKKLLGPCTIDPCATWNNGNNETPFSFNNSSSIQQ